MSRLAALLLALSLPAQAQRFPRDPDHMPSLDPVAAQAREDIRREQAKQREREELWRALSKGGWTPSMDLTIAQLLAKGPLRFSCTEILQSGGRPIESLSFLVAAAADGLPPLTFKDVQIASRGEYAPQPYFRGALPCEQKNRFDTGLSWGECQGTLKNLQTGETAASAYSLVVDRDLETGILFAKVLNGAYSFLKFGDARAVYICREPR